MAVLIKSEAEEAEEVKEAKEVKENSGHYFCRREGRPEPCPRTESGGLHRA